MRDAGLGIADLRDFTRLLRTGTSDGAVGPGARVAFLQRRREELVRRREAVDAALAVLDEKIAHYAAEG